MVKLTLYLTFFPLMLFALLTGCDRSPTVATVPTPTNQPTLPSLPVPTTAPKLTLRPCMLGDLAARCGTLSVYEDRATKTGRMINLNVAVIPARSAHPAPDPIFYIPGGPGEAATEWASYAMQLLGLVNEERDVVLVDQRGTGGSNKLTCSQPADSAQQVEALRTCLANLNSDPSAYTTAWGMDDMDDVRAALGYDQINLYGGSYGTAAAQIYILRHGEHVRTASLDGATLLAVPIFERWPITSQKALDFLFARCETDSTCQSAFPNLRQEFTTVLARLDKGPLTLPLNDPVTGKPTLLTANKFRTAVHGALASTPTAVLVPKLIHLVYSEDWNALAGFVAANSNDDSSTPQWKLMNLTILCNEEWAKIRPAETTAATAGSYLQYEDVRELTVPEAICAAMPRTKAEALYGPLTSSSVPVLIFSGEADPQDPPENVADAKKWYPNSLDLVAPGQGHGFTGLPCRATILADFIHRGSVGGSQTSCLQQVPLPDFVK